MMIQKLLVAAVTVWAGWTLISAFRSGPKCPCGGDCECEGEERHLGI
jgi:hypothetical protein